MGNWEGDPYTSSYAVVNRPQHPTSLMMRVQLNQTLPSHTNMYSAGAASISACDDSTNCFSVQAQYCSSRCSGQLPSTSCSVWR
jgi:hypothetical protein